MATTAERLVRAATSKVGLVVVAASLMGLFLPPEPTGTAWFDALLRAAIAGGATWAAATAPAPAIVAVCAVAATLTDDSIWLGAAIGAAAATLWTFVADRPTPWLQAIATAVSVGALSSTPATAFLGFTAIVASLAIAGVSAAGIVLRSRAVRRRVLLALAATAAVVVIAGIGAAVAAMTARSDLSRGAALAQEGLDALRVGEIDSAAASFDAAARALKTAADDLGRPWAQPARLVPIAAQNLDAARSLAREAARLSSVAATALDAVDPDSVRLVSGRIDVAAVEALVAPFDSLSAALEGLRDVAGAIDSPWLLAPLQTRLAQLELDIDENEPRLDNARAAIDAAPTLLGGEEPRRYFVAFTTPAEARGLGGFMGNWAELTIDAGRISMTDFGRSEDLIDDGTPAEERQVTIPDRIERWTEDYYDADGRMWQQAWLNVTKPPDFPSAAAVIADLFPQSGGRPVDGVFLFDVHALAALLEFTGPVEIDGIPEPLDSANAVDYLLLRQYELDTEVRIDLLESLARETFGQLLGSQLPAPPEIAELFGPLAREGRVLAWSRDPVEQDLFARIGMAGSFPELGPSDGIAITFDNEAPSKIDSFLDVASTYDASFDPHTGALSSRLHVVLTNGAPASGYPDYVIGNWADLPTGTHRLEITVYSAVTIASVAIDGEPSTMTFGEAFGWHSATRLLTIPPRSDLEVEITFAGVVTAGEYSLTTRLQPIAGDQRLDAAVELVGSGSL